MYFYFKNKARARTVALAGSGPLPHIVPVLSGFLVRTPWQSDSFARFPSGQISLAPREVHPRADKPGFTALPNQA